MPYSIEKSMSKAKLNRLERLYIKEDPYISFLHCGIDSGAVQSMLDRTGEIAHDFPWRHMPPNKVPIYVDIPALGIRGAVMTKFEPRPGRHGVALFPSSEHWKAWQQGHEIPRSRLYAWSRLILIFDERAPLTARQEREIKENGWFIPSFYQYPDWFAVGEDGKARSIRKSELEILEAATGTIPGSFYGDAKREWIKVWEGVTPRQEFRRRVHCHRAIVEVTTRSRPLKMKPFAWDRLVKWNVDTNKHHELRTLHKALFKHFRKSHEGYGEGAGEHYIEKFLKIVHEELDCSIAHITPNQLEILITDDFYEVFKWNPVEKVDVMLAILKRFFLYLQRNFRFDAGPLIERLGHRDLRRRLDATWGVAA